MAAPAAQIRSGLHGLGDEALARPAQPDARGPLCPHSGIRSAEKRLKIVMENPLKSVRALCKAIDFIEDFGFSRDVWSSPIATAFK